MRGLAARRVDRALTQSVRGQTAATPAAAGLRCLEEQLVLLRASSSAVRAGSQPPSSSAGHVLLVAALRSQCRFVLIRAKLLSGQRLGDSYVRSVETDLAVRLQLRCGRSSMCHALADALSSDLKRPGIDVRARGLVMVIARAIARCRHACASCLCLSLRHRSMPCAATCCLPAG